MPPRQWPPLFTPSSARSDNPFSPSTRGVDSPIKRCSSASEVLPTVSHKANKAPPAFCSRSKETKNRRKKGDNRKNSVRLSRTVLHLPRLLQNFPTGFASSLVGYLRSSSCVFRVKNSSPFGGERKKRIWNKSGRNKRRPTSYLPAVLERLM